MADLETPSPTDQTRRRLLKGGAVLGGAAWVAPTVIGTSAAAAQSLAGTCVCVDFEGLWDGDPDNLYNVSANQPYQPFVTLNSFDDANFPLVLFDSANPSGGDEDLGTPNQAFSGPGVGAGGASGPGTNSVPLGHVLIINERNAPPPDDNGPGGAMTFTFEQPIFFEKIDILDIDVDNAGEIVLCDENNNILQAQALQNYGENSYQLLTFNQSGVKQVKINCRTSYAVPSFCYCPEP